MTTTTPPCPGCGTPVTDGTICHDCTHRLERLIAGIPNLIRELNTQFARQSRGADRASTSRSAVRPLPYDPRAAAHLDELHRVTEHWTRHLDDQDLADWRSTVQDTPGHPVIAPPRPWAALPIGAQLYRLEQVRWHTHPQADDLLGELQLITEEARQCIDTPPERRYLGPCASTILDADGKPYECTGDVYQLGNKLPTCSACRATHQTDARLEWIADLAADQLVTAYTAAAALSAWGAHIKPELIRLWAHRGRLQQKGHDRAGHPVYRFDDCRTLALETLKKRAEKGQPA
jgi:hypothetical protein